MVESKLFEMVLLVDWKTGKARVTKKIIKNKTKVKPTEIPINLKLNISVPETPVFKAEGNIIIQPIKMNEIILEAIEEKDGEE